MCYSKACISEGKPTLLSKGLYFLRKPNTFEWITVFERCTDDEFWIFKSFLDRVEKKHLTKKYVLDSAIKLERFHNKLIESLYFLYRNIVFLYRNSVFGSL